jgi:GNAT superfamily N-acetyltransferase
MIRETIIRTARHDDSEAIGQIQVRSWKATYEGIIPASYLAAMGPEKVAQTVRLAIMDPRMRYLIAENGHLPVGYIAAGPSRTPDPIYQAEIYELYLVPEMLRHGLGTQLLASMASQLFDKHLYSLKVWVLSRNPNRRFYEKRNGIYLESKPLFFAGRKLRADCFGWIDITLAVS